jgi:hypothetical protein
MRNAGLVRKKIGLQKGRESQEGGGDLALSGGGKMFFPLV